MRQRMRKRRFGVLISIGVVVFLADAAWGMIFSTLTLYATILGASIVLIGGIISGLSLLRALGSFPLGILSDRIERKPIMIMGLVVMLVASVLLVVVFDSFQLVPVSMLLGLGHCAVIPIGYAYVADFTYSTRKGEAIGVYATFMGIGLSIGPIIGGFTSENWGYVSTYTTSSILLLMSLIIAWKTLKKRESTSPSKNLRLDDLSKNFISAMKKRENIIVSIAMFFYAVSFSTIPFYPLYAEKIGLSLTLIGSIIATRTFSSTIVKSPVGMLTKKIQSVILMILGLISIGIILLIIPLLDSYFPLLIILSLEGMCFGTVLTSANTLLAEASEINERGAAIGLLVTFQCTGLTIGPLIWGMIGELWGFNEVFRIASVPVFIVALYLGANRRVLSYLEIG